MLLPRIWAPGQLFAFSALDGLSLATDDFTAMLCADKVALRFYSRVKRELVMANVCGGDLTYEAVTCDYIAFHLHRQDSVRILYARTHLIVGCTAGEVFPLVFVEGLCRTESVDGTELHDTLNGEWTALKRQGNRFAFAYGHSREEVLARIEEGLQLDLEEETQRKLSWYRDHAPQEGIPHKDLYMKCLSVMKTQLYSPEGKYRTLWSTPDRLPHHDMWLWDSVFHALGFRHLDHRLAEDLLTVIFSQQAEDGFIPHMMSVTEVSATTQPPIIAWGAWEVYKTTGSKAFLEEVFRHNKPFLAWCRSNRRLSQRELYTWNTHDNVHCRCGESGMDNSSRFDIARPLFAIDFTSYMANDARHMALIAHELGYQQDEAFYTQWYQQIKADVNASLWSEADGFYFDRVVATDTLHKVWSVASFLPLFAGLCSPEQAARLADHLRDPEKFGTAFPIPSLAVSEPDFGTDMWRGPVWINCNYMIIQGLRENGLTDLADDIQRKTIAHMNSHYQRAGLFYEFYDATDRKTPPQLNRKGPPIEPYNIDVRIQSIRDFGWSTTLLLDMLHT